MRTELGLAWAGLRHRPGPWWLLALGVALAAMMPLTASGLQSVAAVVSVREAVDAVPGPSRGVLAVVSRDLRGPALDSLGQQVRAGFAGAGLPDPEQVLAFRALSLGGTDVTIGALDQLGTDVTLRSGRLPTRCAPRACEVLAVGGAPSPAETRGADRLGLVVTGTADLHEPLLAGLGLVVPGQPLLLGADPGAMTGLEALTLYGRNLGWFAPLDGATVAAVGATELADTLAGISAEVNLVAGPLTVAWPSDAVLAAADRADASHARFAVLGAGAGALELGFVLVVAAGQCRRHQQHAALLVRRGARPAQVLQVATWQPVLAVLVGLVVGSAAGIVTVVALNRGVRARPGAAGWHAWVQTVPTLVVLGLAAVVLAVALARWPMVTGRAVRLLLGLLLLGLAGVVALALADPGSDPSAPLPTAALVGLTIAVGLAGVLVWSPVVAGLGRLRRRPALGGAAWVSRRRPLLPSVTAGFLAAALATALLAGAYAATLQRSAQDQAAATVPLDVRVTPGTQVPLPAEVLDLPRLQAVSPDVRVSGVTSTPVTAFAGSPFATALPLTGVDPDVLPLVHAFAAVTGSDVPASTVADRLRTPAAAVSAPEIPAGVRELRFAVSGLTYDVTLALWFVTPDGAEHQTPLVHRGAEVVAQLPVGPVRRVRAVEVAESTQHLTQRQHAIGEGSTDRQLPAGTLRFGAAYADGATLPWSWAGWGSDRAGSSATPAGLTTEFRLADTRVVLVPGWTAARRPLPVAVDAGTAARAGSRGTFGITVNGTTQPVQIVAVLPRGPALPRAFVLADLAAVRALVDRTAPGTAPVTQVWIDAPGAALPGVRAVLEEGTASAATLQYRTDLEAALAADPVGTGFVRLLGVAGLVALLLSVVAVVSGVRADRDASAADFFALELDGVTPGRLRRLLLVRAGLVLVVGVPLGLAGGAALAAAAVRLLGTGPDGRALVPPLRLVLVSWPTALVALAAAAGTVAAVVLTAAVALRESRLVAPETDLR